MAIARLSVKVGKAGKAAPHADYIAREGQYASRLGRGEALEAKEAGNMPVWAADNPGRFWHAADAFERANGTTYRELELALPRELPPADRAALVRAFVSQELGERHPYQWAIHRPQAADGQDQPHAHLMFSERRLDGIDRDPAQFFRRYNAKAPEKGGAHKRFGEVDGPNRSQAQRAADLRGLRQRWESLVNDHLKRAGRDERIDMRSLKAQGKDRAPEKKQLPSAWRDPQQRATVLEYRQIHKDRDEAAAAFRAVVPDGHVIDLEAHAAMLEAIRAEHQAKTAATLAKLYEERDANTARLEAKKAAEAATLAQRRAEQRAAWLADQPARDAAERERVARVEASNQRELEQQRQRQAARLQAIRDAHVAKLAAVERPPVTRDQAKAPEAQTVPAVEPKAPTKTAQQVYASVLKPITEAQQKAAAASIEALQTERQQWTQAVRDHQAAEPRMFGRKKWERAGIVLDQAGRDLAQREGVAINAADPRAIERAAVAELRRVAPAVMEAAASEKRKEAEAQAAEKEKDAPRKEFELMAFSRERGAYGYGDRSDKWQAFPDELKQKIENYNRLPNEQRPKELERIGKDPRTMELLKEAKVVSRSQERGR